MAKRMKQDKIDKLMLDIPSLPKSFDKWMSKSPFTNMNYVFYKRKGKKKIGYCSRCESLFTYESRKKHNDLGKCCCCKAQVTFKAINQAKTYQDLEIVSIIQKMNEGFVVRYFNIRRTFKQYQDTSNFPDEILETLSKPVLEFYEGSRVYIDVKTNRHSRFTNLESEWTWHTEGYRWVNERKRSGFNNKLLLRDSNPFMYKKNLKGLLKNSKWKYSGLDFFKEKHMNIDDYLFAYEKYPSIEIMSKLKMSNLLSDVIRLTNWGNSFFGEYVKLDQIRLGLSKETFKKAISMNLNLRDLKRLAYYSEKKPELSDEMFLRIKDYGTEFMKKILKYSSVEKAINYVEKNKDHENNLICGTWKDYIDQCEYLGMDLEESIVLYPKDLFSKHDEYTQTIQDMKNELIIKRFNIKSEYWCEKLNFNKGKLTIKVAESIESLKTEGEAHGHCVGGYGPRVAKNNIIVLFVRKKDNKPFFTVELNLKTLEVIQIQGKARRAPTNEVKSFIKAWQSNINHKRLDINLKSA